MAEAHRREFGEKLMQAHAAYQAERDRQYDIYKLTCTREQGVRDRELARLDPTDRAGMALTHDAYDKVVRRAGHIYDRYEERAWAKYNDTAERLRAEYGIKEQVP
jgi:hypothetical protein